MSNVLIALFKDTPAAESVMQALNVTVSYKQARVSDICLITKDDKDNLSINQKFSRPDHFFLIGLGLGAVAGAIAGVTLFGMFAMPIVILAGAIGGLALAAVYAMVTDIGLSDDFLHQLGTKMRAGSAAIAVLHKPDAQKWMTSALEKGGADLVMNVHHDANEEDAALRTMSSLYRT